MSWVIKIIDTPGRMIHNKYAPPKGSMIRHYDPEGHSGFGDVLFTMRVDKAIKFNTAEEAYKFWLQIPKNRPVRDDGLPNRPLTAFTVEVVQL